MFVLDGHTLLLDTPFSHNGVNYPANWLRSSSLAEKQAIGIQEVPDPPFYDARFYFGYDYDGKLIPKDHAPLVIIWAEKTRQSANNLLSSSDWMIIREADNGTPVDTAWRAWRESIRLSVGEKVAAIEATTTTDELAAYITGLDYSAWPENPGDAAVNNDG